MNIFNKTKTISSLDQLLNLPSYKGYEDVKQNGNLLYRLHDHKFDVITRSDRELLAEVSYTYMTFTQAYKNLSGAKLYVESINEDAQTIHLKSDDEFWSLEYDSVCQTLHIYPNILGWFDDKCMADIEMITDDLSADDQVFCKNLDGVLDALAA